MYPQSRDFKMANVKHVVIDSGAFIRNAPIESIGEKCYTLQDVVEEIRDRATRQRLQFMPYELIFREPSTESIRFVTEFSKKTGDYRSLSAVDIRLMALTYQLEKEFVGTDHIKAEPDKKVQWTATSRPLERATDIAGFYLKPKKTPTPSRTTSECSSQSEAADSKTGGSDPSVIVVERIQENTEPEEQQDNSQTEAQSMDNQNENISAKVTDTESENSEQKTDEKDNNKSEETDRNSESDTPIKTLEPSEGDVISADCIEEEEEEDDESDDDEDDDDDDDDGWITPSNIKSMKAKMGGEELTQADVAVGCLTTDFAMQNVLIQMGLNVISVDGCLIKRAKSFVLRCFACMKITTNVQKRFCPHCGNKTLSKVSMTVEEDGSVRYFLSRRRPTNTRGTKYSLPTPKGGKHAANPILFADQPTAQNRMPKKANAKVDVFNPDFVAKTSPFAMNDVTSRAAQLGLTGRKGQTHNWDRRNPNESRRKTGRKK